MKTRTWFVSVVLAAAASCGIAPRTFAQPPDLFLQFLDDHLWVGGTGTQDWHTAANWNPADVPNDPGRQDLDETVFVNVEGANLSVPLGGNLTVDLGAASATMAALKFGSTTTARTTDVTASGAGVLVFENYEANDDPEPGAPPNSPTIYGFNKGRALIWSTGVAGSINRISAPIQLNDDVNIEGDRDFTILGDILEGPENRVVGAETVGISPTLSAMLSDGRKLTIAGNIILLDTGTEGDPMDPDRPVSINLDDGERVIFDPDDTDDSDPIARTSTVEITGAFIGSGDITFGNVENSHSRPISTVILRADNADDPDIPNDDPETPEIEGTDQFFSGEIYMNRVNLVLGHNHVFGAGEDPFEPVPPPEDALESGELKTSNPNQGFGFNFISDNDARNIPNTIEVAQWSAVKGATDVDGIQAMGDHSLEFSGRIEQTNTRGWVNLLPDGKTLTLSGPQYPLEGANNADPERKYTIDGTGKTLITGGIHDRPAGAINPGKGNLRVRGTGVVVVNYDETNTADTPSDFAGYTWVEGSNLHFGTNDDLGGQQILSSGGAVGVDSGVVGNSTFLAKLNNSSNPLFPGATPTAPPFFLVFDINEAVLTNYSSGGLMLAAGEYGANLDFTTGDMARAANMSLAAHEGGSSYTGTITPSTSIVVNPNTYHLGGGKGTLTLPNANQLTGARDVVVTNGGEVFLDDTNNYTGSTRIRGKYRFSVQAMADADEAGFDGEFEGFEFNGGDFYQSSTLTVPVLANGGQASSIGQSTSDASNLVIQGSTLKYIGGATSTDRLFTVGTVGATIEASGSGALSFTNAGSLTIDHAEDRNGAYSDSVPGPGNNEVFGVPTAGAVFSTEDLVPGMRIVDVNAVPIFVDDDSPLVVTSITSQNAITIGETDIEDDNDTDPIGAPPNPWSGGPAGTTVVRPMNFGPAPARMLTLSGSNTGNNTLAPIVGNAPDIGEATADEVEDDFGTVGISKQGAGTWILTGNNTYGGATNVEEGTLLINGSQTGGGTTTVSVGATLGGTGTLPGALNNLGTVAPGTSAGTLTVTGNYSQSIHGTLAIEIGGTTAGAFDLLDVNAGVDTGPVEGDYNEDGAVNSADYTFWRNHLGETFQLPNEGEDASPGVVDDEDYDFWKGNYGDANLSFGDATISGTINIDLINGFAPANGNMFTILTAESVKIGSLALAGEKAGFSLLVNPTSLVLQYTGAGGGGFVGANVPEPASLMLVGTVVAALCMLRRRN